MDVARFRRDAGGSTAVEFALTANALLLCMFGILEGCLMYWNWQAMQSTAIEAARCAAINAPSCLNVATTPANTQTYAVNLASTRGVTGVTASARTLSITAAAKGICGQVAAGGAAIKVVSVTVSYTFGPIPLYALSPKLSATACFPLAS